MKAPRILLAMSLLAAPACGDDAAPKDTDTGADVADSSDTSGDDASDSTQPNPHGFCESAVRFDWDPVAGRALNAFPDDSLTRDDDESATAVRVDIGDPPWLADESDFFRPVWRQLEQLDGFGTSAGIVLRFSAPIKAPPASVLDSVLTTSIQLWDLGSSQQAAQRVPYTAELLEEGKTLILTPVRPLRESQLHAVLVTRDHLAEDGSCIAPSPTLQGLLVDEATDPKITRLKTRKDAFLDQTGVEPNQVSALSLFTTQTIFTRTLTQRLELRTKTYDWKTAPTCTTSGALKKCLGVMQAWDFRIEGYLGDRVEPVAYDLPVHIWLKNDVPGPTPILFFGHGLGGEASQSTSVAQLAANSNLATVAISAPRHGDHPTARVGGDENSAFLDLFGIDIAQMTINGFVFRENLRQAAFDKLQVLELLAAHPDIDGDGTPDVNADRVVYWGISLGGIMGANFAAQTDRVDAAILSVPGARLISVATDSENFSTFADLLATMVGGPDALRRLASPAQTLIDAGDPVNWAARLVTNRVDSGRAPHVLLQMVMDDEVVPNVSTEALARAIETPQVPPLLSPIDPLRAEPRAPVSANASGRTQGLFQFDTVTISGQERPATHNNLFSGTEGVTQLDTFLKSWSFDVDASPVIMSPYSR